MNNGGLSANNNSHFTEKGEMLLELLSILKLTSSRSSRPGFHPVSQVEVYDKITIRQGCKFGPVELITFLVLWLKNSCWSLQNERPDLCQ